MPPRPPSSLPSHQGPWYEVGAGDYDLPVPALLAIQFPIMGILELKRVRGWWGMCTPR